MRGTEIICLPARPALIYIYDFYEYAGPLPLYVDKCISVRTVSYANVLLVLEHSQSGVPRRRVPRRVVPDIEANLHLHDLFDHIELEIIPEPRREQWQRHHLRIGGELEQGGILQMELPDGEVLGQACGEDTHRLGVLANYAKGVIVGVVVQQGIAEVGLEIPSRDVQGSLHLCGGYLSEIIVPTVVVGKIVLLIPVRFAQVGLESCRERERAALVPPERVETEVQSGGHVEIIKLVTREIVTSVRVPVEIFLILSLGSGIDIEAVEAAAALLAQVTQIIESKVVEELVSYSYIYFGDYSVALPRLQAQVNRPTLSEPEMLSL